MRFSLARLGLALWLCLIPSAALGDIPVPRPQPAPSPGPRPGPRPAPRPKPARVEWVLLVVTALGGSLLLLGSKRRMPLTEGERSWDS